MDLTKLIKKLQDARKQKGNITTWVNTGVGTKWDELVVTDVEVVDDGESVYVRLTAKREEDVTEE